jgi:peptidoglycan hydrolase-like protein with peptidoglycan-binding domain
MKKTMIKRTLTVIFVIALVIAVYSPPAYCTSPTPSPTATVSPSATATATATPPPEDSTAPDGSGEPSQTASGFPLQIGSSGSQVIRVQIRLRDLGFFNFRPTGNYYNKTDAAVRDFQKNNGLDIDGDIGEQTYQKLFTNTGLTRMPINPSAIPDSGDPLIGNPQGYGELGDWATINTEFTSTAKVTDFNNPTISFNVTRTGGTNLATVEVSTAADYAKFLECFGGSPSWEKRSVLVTIGSKNYAASLFGNPSGEDKLSSNEMQGHTTLYFFGSATDVSGFIDKEDLWMVMRAAGKSVQNDRPIYDYCPEKYQ